MQAGTMDSAKITTEAPERPDVHGGQGPSLAEYLEIVKRRFWLLLLPAVLVFAAFATVAMMLPAVYESTATILIEEQEIPEDLVRTTVTTYADQRVQVIAERVLNSAKLTEIIEKFDLYPEAREAASVREVVGEMRGDITVSMVRADVRDRQGRRGGGATIAFRLAYQSQSPEQARQVVNELTALFLEENIRQRQQAARETTVFLSQEGDRLAEEVAEMEARLASFKEANINSLPENQTLNMNLLQRTEDELRRNEQDLRANSERVDLLQSQLAQTTPSRHLDRVRALEAEYASLAALYTERHPDRISVQRELEALRAEEAQAGNAAVNNPAYDNLQNQLQVALGERRSLQAARADLREKLAEIEHRLSTTPVIDSQYRSMTRDYETALDKLRDLRAKQLNAELAETLETESRAERFVVSERASLPTEPIKPNRLAILFLGLVFSVGSGVGTVVVREHLDTAIHGPKDVARATGAPPLAVIPYIQTDAERTAMVQRRLLLTLGVIALIGLALAVIHYQVTPLDELYTQWFE
jgi:polysaccharide biosynthesis transport protein